MRLASRILCELVQKTDKPRGRPRSFDPDVALRSAGERFRTQGFAATSLDDLVDATGLARPSLYAAFGDKKALYLAALAGTAARAEKAFAALADSRPTLREAVTNILTFTIEGYLTGERGPSGCIVISTAPPEATTDPEVRAALARFIAMEDERTADILRAAGSTSPEAHGRLIAAVIHSLSVRARAGATRAEMLAMAAECADLVAPA